MSSAAGPIVPLRTGSAVLRALSGSVSLKVFSVICAADFHGQRRAQGSAQRVNQGGLHGRRATIKARGRPRSAAHPKEGEDPVEGAARAPGAARRAAPKRCYFVAAPAAAYFLRNLSTRPAVSTIFCLPV